MPDNTKIKTNYAGLPIIKVRLLTKKTAWLVVKLEDGRKGMIPRKEWGWSRGKSLETPVFSEGSSFDAVLLPESVESGYAYLSIKELHNPWESAEKDFYLHKVVLGEVVNLRNIAAYIEVAPGITAVLWASDMPLLPEQIPADFLSVGDRLFVVITGLDLVKKRMQVSATTWFQRLDTGFEEQKTRLERAFQPKVDRLYRLHAEDSPKVSPPVSKEFRVKPLTNLRKILIIDDTPSDRDQLNKQIKRAFPAEVIMADAGETGLAILKSVPDIDLVILDIGLGNNEYGPSIASAILQLFPQMHLIFSSSDPFRFSEILGLENQTSRIFPFVQKTIPRSDAPPDESLAEVIHLLFDGLIYRFVNKAVRSKDSFIEQLGASSMANMPLQQALDSILFSLARSNFIDHAVIVELDSLKKEFSIVASYPKEQDFAFKNSLDGMYYSQAKDVIEQEEILYVDHITQDMKANRFKNFFRQIRFQSCYGVPIQLSNGNVKHGLFVLDKKPDFTWDNIMHIRTTASYASVALERADMLKILRKYEERYFMGQLFGTFIHELKNNFEALDGYFDLVKIALNRNETGHALTKLGNLETTANDLKALANSYVRFVHEGVEEININEVIGKALRQLEHIAKIENHVEIRAILDDSIPTIWANALHVEQVILNVALNAVQHVSAQYRSLMTVSEVRSYQDPLQICRSVIVESSLVQAGKMCQIMVMDTGPGVPLDQQDKIFLEGVSTRAEGHGLGLFISKNLVEAMQGQLILLESIRYSGSAFVITFPIYQ